MWISTSIQILNDYCYTYRTYKKWHSAMKRWNRVYLSSPGVAYVEKMRKQKSVSDALAENESVFPRKK